MENISNNRSVIIIGGSGHAKVVIDIIETEKTYSIIGYTDIKPSPPIKRKDYQIPFLGDDRILKKIITQGINNAFVAVGDNYQRKKIYTQVCALGFNLISCISQFAYVSPTVKVGQGTVIMPGAVIHPDTIIGDNCIINTNASVDHDGIINSHCHIAPGSNLAGNVTLGEGVFLGIGTKVIPKITIGNWTSIGAGGVVVSDIPNSVLAVGIPAKVVKNI